MLRLRCLNTPLAFFLRAAADFLTNHVSPRDHGSRNMTVAICPHHLGQVGTAERLTGLRIVLERSQTRCAFPTPKNLFEGQCQRATRFASQRTGSRRRPTHSPVWRRVLMNQVLGHIIVFAAKPMARSKTNERQARNARPRLLALWFLVYAIMRKQPHSSTLAQPALYTPLAISNSRPRPVTRVVRRLRHLHTYKLRC